MAAFPERLPYARCCSKPFFRISSGILTTILCDLLYLWHLPILGEDAGEAAGLTCPKFNNWSVAEKGFEPAILVPMEAAPETDI